jgi:hypothetical protein
MPQYWNLYTTDQRKNFGAFIDGLLLAGKRPRVVIEPDGKRTLSQNDLVNTLYGEIAKQVQDQRQIDIRRECKLRYGVGILRAGNAQFRSLYDSAIKSNLCYEAKLEAMDILPVTSLMNKAQCTEYIDTVIREYSKQGYSIVMPGEEQ